MAVKQKTTFTPTAALAPVEADDFKTAKPKSKGRPKKVKESELEKQSPRSLKVVTPESNKDAGSKVFARLMTSKSKSADGDMTASGNDASLSFEGKTRPKGRRAKRVRASLSESKDSNVCTVNFTEGKSSTRNTFSNIIEGPKSALTSKDSTASNNNKLQSKQAKEIVETKAQDVSVTVENGSNAKPVAEVSVIPSKNATPHIEIASDIDSCEEEIGLKSKVQGKIKSKSPKEINSEIHSAFAKLMASKTKTLAKASTKTLEPNPVIVQTSQECAIKEPKAESKVTQNNAFSKLMCPKSKISPKDDDSRMEVIEIADFPQRKEPLKNKGKRGRPKSVGPKDHGKEGFFLI